jgi:hypothetical protein
MALRPAVFVLGLVFAGLLGFFAGTRTAPRGTGAKADAFDVARLHEQVRGLASDASLPREERAVAIAALLVAGQPLGAEARAWLSEPFAERESPLEQLGVEWTRLARVLLAGREHLSGGRAASGQGRPIEPVEGLDREAHVVRVAWLAAALAGAEAGEAPEVAEPLAQAASALAIRLEREPTGVARRSATVWALTEAYLALRGRGLAVPGGLGAAVRADSLAFEPADAREPVLAAAFADPISSRGPFADVLSWRLLRAAGNVRCGTARREDWRARSDDLRQRLLAAALTREHVATTLLALSASGASGR